MAAAEIRAEIARQGLSRRAFAMKLGVSYPWVARRIGTTADVDMTLEDIVKMTQALGISAQGLLSVLLPRLDSNQQPSGYSSPLVRGVTRAQLALVA